jgi:ketosteroid isomerase-like protein/predicted ester cyclase
MAPTEADIERVIAAYEEFNARFEQIKSGDLTGFEDYCAPDLVMISVDGWPLPGRYEGLDGYRRWIHEVYGGTAWNRFENIEVQIVGDYVIATMLSRGQADDDPTEMEAPVNVVHELRDGLIARAWLYLDRERALNAASNVAHIRGAYEDFNARYEELADPEVMRAYHEHWYDPESQIINVDGWPVPASYEGLEGYTRWYGENYATYDDVRFDVESVEPVADRVVALARVSGRPKGEEMRLEIQIGVTYELRRGRIWRVRLYLGHERALQAAAEASPA